MQKLDIRVNLSKQLILLKIALLLMSEGIIISLPFTVAVKSILISGVLLYSCAVLYRHCLLQFLTHDENGWRIKTRHGEFLGELCGDSTVTSLLSVLRFKVPGKFFKQSFVVFHDAMEKEQYRQLIVRARNAR